MSDLSEKWAEQFPTNVVIQDLIKLKERSIELPYCKPCQSKGTMTNQAKFFCKTMNSFFCESCKKQYHDIIHTDCDILDISEYDIRRSKEEESVPKCHQHEEKKLWYCEKHNCLGCSECMIKFHKQCEIIIKAREYLEKVKSGKQLEDMKEKLKKGADVLKSLVKDFDERIQTLVQNQEMALKSITDLRKRIDEELDECQKAVTDELVTKYKEEKEKMDVSLRQCDRLMKGMLSTMKFSVKAVEENNPTEAIMMYQRGQAEIESCQDLIKDMRDSSTSVSIQHQVPKSRTEGVAMLGKIVIEKKPRRFPVVSGFLPVPMLERQAKAIKKFNIKMPEDQSYCCVCGVLYLPDGTMVVSDWNNSKLKLFTDEGEYQDQLTIPGNPRDVCLVDNNTVAVTGYRVGVRIVKVEDSKLSLLSIINTEKDLKGITHTDGRFVVSEYGGGVYSLTQDGAINLLHQYNTTCWYLANITVTGDIIISVGNDTEGKITVSRLSADKRHTDVMKAGVVKPASGIDVDREGNIYVCGWDSHNLVQMSGDGTRARELFTSAAGIKKPEAVSVCGDRFVVSNDNHANDERNCIRIFQLY